MSRRRGQIARPRLFSSELFQPEDDTAFRGEPEPVDVWADQAPADWSEEPSSDRSLSIGVWERLGDLRGAE